MFSLLVSLSFWSVCLSDCRQGGAFDNYLTDTVDQLFFPLVYLLQNTAMPSLLVFFSFLSLIAVNCKCLLLATESKHKAGRKRKQKSAIPAAWRKLINVLILLVFNETILLCWSTYRCMRDIQGNNQVSFVESFLQSWQFRRQHSHSLSKKDCYIVNWCYFGHGSYLGLLNLRSSGGGQTGNQK